MIALAISGKALSIFTILGIIMLTGLVAKNAILLVDRTNQTRLEQGLSVYEALLEAAQSRLRPILMTTLTMTLVCCRLHYRQLPDQNGNPVLHGRS